MGSLIPVSIVILTFNEASRIQRCLESVSEFKQIIIVDSLSTDGTLEKARKFWIDKGFDSGRLHLYSRKWPGFTKARNESVEWAQEDWIFWVDADEWLSPELIEELKLMTWPSARVLKIQRQSFFLNRAIRHGGWFPDHKRRLAPRLLAEWRPGPRSADVHEDLFLKSDTNHEEAQLCDGFLFHEPFRDYEEQESTNQYYSSLLAKGLAQKWKLKGDVPPSDLYIAVKFGIKFIENYIFKLGFLDGYAGWKIATGSAMSMRWRLQKARALALSDDKTHKEVSV